MTDTPHHTPTAKKYLGLTLRVELRGGWRYKGRVTDEDEVFITLHDDRNGRGVVFRRDQIVRLEEL